MSIPKKGTNTYRRKEFVRFRTWLSVVTIFSFLTIIGRFSIGVSYLRIEVDALVGVESGFRAIFCITVAVIIIIVYNFLRVNIPNWQAFGTDV